MHKPHLPSLQPRPLGSDAYARPWRMLLLSLVLGIVGGLGAVVFLDMLALAQRGFLGVLAGVYPLSVMQATHLHAFPGAVHWNWWILLSTTLGGLIAGVLVYTFAPEAEGHGTDSAVKSFHQLKGYIRARVIVVKSIASAITIGSGGAAGREGPTAQIAAGIGSLLGRLLRLSDDEKRLMVLVGMAAGLSAIFKSPLGTAIFAVEVLYSGMHFEGRALPFTLTGSAVAYAVICMFNGWSTLFTVPLHVDFNSPEQLLWYALLGVVCGLMGTLLPNVFYGVRDGFRKLPIPDHFKPAIGGLLVGLIALVFPQILGGGYGIMQLAVQGTLGTSMLLLLLLSVFKVVALALTVGSGGSGGVFAPSLFVGALLGAAFWLLLHQLGVSNEPAAGMALVGMAAVFGAGARVPVATTVMVAEMTGGYKLMAPTMLAVAIAYLLQVALTRYTPYPSLYEAQMYVGSESSAHPDDSPPPML